MKGLPPLRICIAAGLAICVGVDVLVEFLAQALAGSFFFNLMVVGIPIGYGLLIGRNSSRKWAVFYSGAGLLLALVAGGRVLYLHLSEKASFPYPEKVYFGFNLALIAIACIYVFVTLRHPLSRDWFDDDLKKNSAAKKLAWSVSLIAAFLSMSNQIDTWKSEAILDRIELVDVGLVLVDSETGDRIRQASLSMPEALVFNPGKKGLPKVSIITIGEPEGIKFQIQGAISHPYGILVSSDGFETKHLLLDEETPSYLRVPLKRTPKTPSLKTEIAQQADDSPSTNEVQEQ